MKSIDWPYVFPEVPSGFHNRIQTTLNALAPVKKERNGSFMKKRRFIIVLAAVLACGVLTAGAAYLFRWDDKLAEQYEVSEQQQTELAEAGIVADVEQSVSDNGLTVTAVQTLGDKNGIYILLKVRVPDGMVITGDNCFDRATVTIEGGRINVFSSFMSGDGKTAEQGGENEYYYEINIYNNEQADLNGRQVTVDLQNLQDDAGKLDMYTVLEGRWELSWKLDYTDHTRTYDIGHSYDMNGHEIIVEAIELSPLSISVRLSGEGVGQLYDILDVGHCNNLVIPTVMLKDDTTFAVIGCGSEGWTDSPGQTYVMRSCFDRILDISQVSGVRLDFPTGDAADMISVDLAD